MHDGPGSRRLIADLVEKYGFLPSCGGSEALCIADPSELWVMEICSVGPDWTPESGKPGAIWAARRVPDDHVVVIANYVRIREIDLKNPDFMASPNYMQEAIDRGWYDPTERPAVHLAGSLRAADPGREPQPDVAHHSTLAPVVQGLAEDGGSTDPPDPATLYAQPIEGAAFYPFSVKPEKKLSVQDVIAFQRSAFEDTDLRHDLGPGLDGSGRRGQV